MWSIVPRENGKRSKGDEPQESTRFREVGFMELVALKKLTYPPR
jgi:hypothetical protein